MSDRISLLGLCHLGHEHGGSQWYLNARVAARALADTLGASPERTCDVLAITSPRVRVARSIELTRLYLGGSPVDRIPLLPNVRTALASYEATGRINGPKTSAFARALRGDDSVVVVDTWILQALGVPKLTGLASYRRAADRVRALSYRLRATSTAPWAHATTQACLWVGYQVHNGRSPAEMEG